MKGCIGAKEWIMKGKWIVRMNDKVGELCKRIDSGLVILKVWGTVGLLRIYAREMYG